MIQDSEKARKRRKRINAILFIILVIVFILFIFPFILVVINVFKEKVDIVKNPLSLIGEKKGFTLQNFPNAMQKMDVREFTDHYSDFHDPDADSFFHDSLRPCA